MNSLNKDVSQILFDCLDIPTKYNYYLYCQENDLTGELQYVEKYFQSLYTISKPEWYNIIIDNILPEGFTAKYKDVIDWRMLSIYQKFTHNFLYKYSSYIEWDNASRHQDFTQQSLKRFQHFINWSLYSVREDLTEETISNFSNLFIWEFVKIHDFTDEFLQNHKENIQWSNVSFTDISRYEDYTDNVDWVRLSYHEELTEDFMRRNQERLNWNFLSSHQIMSVEFEQEFSERINTATRNFFNNRRRRNAIIGIPSIIPYIPTVRQTIPGIIPNVPELRRHSRFVGRPSFFEY